MEQAATPIIIPFNKTPLTIQALLCLGFVSTGLVWIINPPFAPGSFMGNRIVTTIIGSLFIFFFGSASISFLKKVLSGKPAIKIAPEGFTDNASGVAAGFIPWKDLSGFSIDAVGRQWFLKLYFQDPETYIGMVQNRFQQRLMDATYKRYGTPVQVPLKALKADAAFLRTSLRLFLSETEN